MESIQYKTKIAAIWNIIEKFFIQIISFSINIILARLLSPKDYGTIGLLTVFLNISNVFMEGGFTKALIQKKDRSESDYSTVLLFNLIISIFIYGLLYLIAPFIAKFYQIQELTKVSRVLFLILIINSLTIIHNTILQIQINFKKIAIFNLISTLISGITAIIFAYKGFGVWTLVIQALLKSFLTCLFYWFFSHWFPRSFFSFSSFKQLFGFGSKLLIGRLLTEVLQSLNNLILGKVYLADNLGYYTRAQQFPEIIAGTINNVVSGVTFPLFSALQDNKELLVDNLTKMIKLSAMVIFPCMFGISILSKPIILVLLGEKWQNSISLLSWLALSYLFLPITCLNANVIQVIGKAGLYLKLLIVNFILNIISIMITFSISLKAVVIGKFIVSVIYFLMHTFLVGKLFNFGTIRQIKCIIKYFFSSLVMTLIIYFLRFIISSSLFYLIAGIISGVVIYSICLFLLKDELFLTYCKKIRYKIK